MSQNDEAPNLTIIMSTLNAGLTLRKALESLEVQTSADFELLIIDGGSTDKTISIIRSFDHVVTLLISENDDGIYDAWNKAIRYARGEWIYFMGADDCLAGPHVIAQALQALDLVNKNVVIAYGRVIHTSKSFKPKIVGETWAKYRKKLGSEMPLPHQAVFHEKNFLKRHKFDASYKVAADYKLLLQSLTFSEPQFLGQLIFSFQSADGVSGRRENRKLVLKEFSRARRESGYKTHLNFYWLYAKALLWELIHGIRRLR